MVEESEQPGHRVVVDSEFGDVEHCDAPSEQIVDRGSINAR